MVQYNTYLRKCLVGLSLAILYLLVIQTTLVESSSAITLSRAIAKSASSVLKEIKSSESPCYRLRRKLVKTNCQLSMMKINRKLRKAQRGGRKFKKMMLQVRGKLLKLSKKFKRSKRAISRVEQVKFQLNSKQLEIFDKAKLNKKCFHSKIKQLKQRISSFKKIIKEFEQIYQNHTNELLSSLSKCRRNLKKIKTCKVSKKYFKGLPKNLYGLLRSLDVKFACLKNSKGSDKLKCMKK